MRIPLLLFLLALGGGVLVAAERVPEVGEIDLRAFIAAYNARNVLLVDCRGSEAYAKGHVPGAIDGSLTAEELDLFRPLDPEAPVVLYGADARDRSWHEVATKFAGAEVTLERFAAGHAGLTRIFKRLDKGPMREREAKGLEDARDFRGRTYLIDAPEPGGDRCPALLVWAHPASGTPGPEFAFWRRSGLIGEDVILLCPKAWGRGWQPSHDARFVHELVGEVMTTYDVDPARVVFGGHSSGAIFTLSYALDHPDRYRHLVVACGTSPGELPAAGEDAPAVSLYHSRDDKVFTWTKLEEIRAQLEQQGYAVDLTEDAQGHGIGPKLIERMRAVLAGLEPEDPAAEADADR